MKPGDESHKKKGGNTKHHLAVDAHGVSVRMIATEGTRADSSEAACWIEGIDAQHLIADKGYDSDALIRRALDQGMQAQIPPRKNRQAPREYDKRLHRQPPNRICFSAPSMDGAESPRVRQIVCTLRLRA
jgi:IS5 family transposase